MVISHNWDRELFITPVVGGGEKKGTPPHPPAAAKKKKNLHILILGTLNVTLYGKLKQKRLYRCDWIKGLEMGRFKFSGWALNAVTHIFVRGRHRFNRPNHVTETERSRVRGILCHWLWKWKKDHEPKECSTHWKRQENRFSLQPPRGGSPAWC